MTRLTFTALQAEQLRDNARRNYAGNHPPVALVRNSGGPGLWLITAFYPIDEEQGFGLADPGNGSPESDRISFEDIQAHCRSHGGQPVVDPAFDAGARPLSQFEHQAARDGALAPERVLAQPVWLLEPAPTEDGGAPIMELAGPNGRCYRRVLRMHTVLDSDAPYDNLMICRGANEGDGALELYGQHLGPPVYLGAPDPDEVAALHAAGPDAGGTLNGYRVARSDPDDIFDYILHGHHRPPSDTEG